MPNIPYKNQNNVRLSYIGIVALGSNSAPAMVGGVTLGNPGAGSRMAAARYLYADKEYEAAGDVREHNFGARRLSTSLPRWTTPDPMSEKYYPISPYAYCAAGPINLIDPSARDVGNYVAGYVVGSNGINWLLTRLAFDGYQNIDKILEGRFHEIEPEGITTVNAEFAGWKDGVKSYLRRGKNSKIR